jgi:hypothetical protein
MSIFKTYEVLRDGVVKTVFDEYCWAKPPQPHYRFVVRERRPGLDGKVQDHEFKYYIPKRKNIETLDDMDEMEIDTMNLGVSVL